MADEPEQVSPEYLQAMKDWLELDEKRHRHVAALRGGFLALVLDIEQEIKLVLADLMLVAPEAKGRFHEVMFDRVATGGLVERLRDALRAVDRRTEHDELLRDLDRVAKDRNVMAHEIARFETSPFEDGDTVLVTLKVPLSALTIDAMFERCRRCLEEVRDLHAKTRSAWFDRFPEAFEEIRRFLENRDAESSPPADDSAS